MTQTQTEALEAIAFARARKFRWATGGALEWDDLLQVARIGAAQAVATFDASRGSALTSHAWRVIGCRLLRAVEHAGPVKVPETSARRAWRETGKRRHVFKVGLKEDHEDLDCTFQDRRAPALTADVEDPAVRLDAESQAARVAAAVARIPSIKQRWAVEQLYLQERSYTDLAAEIGVTRQAIENLERKGLAWLARALRKENE